MATNFTFEEEHFNRIFPFYILINQQMIIESNGTTLEKLFKGLKGKNFEECFTIKRPQLNQINFQALKTLSNQLLVVECFNTQRTILRGQIDYLPQTNQLLFLGSPWFDSIEEVIQNKLSLHDFAFHDSMTDLLHVLKTHENTNDDLKHLLITVNTQRDELKKANKENHDIALFPTQNPDPLMRINFDGDLLQNNPAAALLDFVEYDNKLYRNDEFFKIISDRIDKNEKRWTIEASSDEKQYSFACITMLEEGYINIYGRDITQQKKDQQELQKLSHIIQQTINAVIITDASGRIEWVNNAFEKVTGYNLTETKGKKPGHLLQGKDTNPTAVEYMRTQISKAMPFTCEIYNYKKSGEGYWLRINGQPIFDKQGKVSQFFAIEEDITKEKETQEKLKDFDKRINLAMQKIGDNVWEHNFASEETTFSQQQFLALGYSSDDFNKNVDLWYNCIHPDDKKLVNGNDIKYRSGEIDHHSLEYRMISKGGEIKWVLDRGVVIEKFPDKKPLRIIGTHTDITQQKNNEKELEATASRLSSLITNLHAGVLLENEDHTIVLVNNQFCDMFEIAVEPASLTGANCADLAQQTKSFFKDQMSFLLRVEEVLTERKLVLADRLELIDGRFVERAFIPIWNENKFDGNLWVFTDITDKINADKKLEEQRIFYEEILDNIPADIAVFDHQHRYLYLNPKAVKDQKIRKWMIGKTDEDYIRFRKKPESILEARRAVFNSIIKTKQLTSWEEEMLQPDGVKQVILRNMYPVINNNDGVKLVIGYGVDITQIKKIQRQIEQSEKKYRDVIDNSLAIVTTHDLNGNFISVNPVVGKIYGYKDEEMIGHALTEFMPAEDKSLFQNQYLDKIKLDKQASGIFRVLHKDGKIIYSLYNNFLKEEPGEQPYVIGFAVDITDRIEAEKQLKIAKKVTEEMAQTKQNFLANMSHEIRTPMNAIMGMTNQLFKTALNKDQQFYLNIIHSASDNLLIIINDILDLSKIEAGKLTIENIGFEPQAVIDRAMQVMMHRAEEKGLKFTNSFCDTKLSPVLLGDPYRLNQVLLNLISNAVKFTAKGTVDITCKVIKDAEDKQKIEATVTDTGIGMDDSFAKNLFEKFSQEDDSTTRKYGGTGLGMSICKELVALMGGEIKVTSKKGIGTSMSFIIELQKGTEKDLPVKETTQTDTKLLAGKKILVTDDNEMNQLVAATMLQNYGAEITEAFNGQEAIDKIKVNQFDIVLMDVQMPVMDGLEATKIIRATISKDLPIVALTAFAIKGDNDKCMDAGMNDYLTKPFEESQLLSIVSKWLGKAAPKKIEVVQDVTIAEGPLYDLSKLHDIARGNAAFIDKMVTLFIEQIPPAVKEIQEAYDQKNYEIIKKVAHRIKPSIDNMGIATLKPVIREIELLALENPHSPKLNDLIKQIDNTLKKVIESLQ
jgi:PAS domain S-box-containing protein